MLTRKTFVFLFKEQSCQLTKLLLSSIYRIVISLPGITAEVQLMHLWRNSVSAKRKKNLGIQGCCPTCQMLCRTTALELCNGVASYTGAYRHCENDHHPTFHSQTSKSKSVTILDLKIRLNGKIHCQCKNADIHFFVSFQKISKTMMFFFDFLILKCNLLSEQQHEQENSIKN